MNYYKEGYEKGYADVFEGKPEKGMFEAAFSRLVDEVFNDKEQMEWEEGYEDGYEAGKKEIEDDE